MRIRNLSLVLAGVSPLIHALPAAGDFVGVETTVKPNDLGLFVCNVYAVFDRPGDHLIAVAATPENPFQISVIGGTFFQSRFGTDRPPNPLFFQFAESLRYDTYVTIGVKSFNSQKPGVPEGQLEDDMVLAALWPGFGRSVLEGDRLAWFVLPDAPQGDAFNPEFVAGDGRVLLAQLSTADGSGFEGTMTINYESGGANALAAASFQHVEQPPCPWDCDGSGDGAVNVLDLLALLAQFDPQAPENCDGGTCDYDGDGCVTVIDLLKFLAHRDPAGVGCP